MLYLAHAVLIACGALLALGMAVRELVVDQGPWAGNSRRAGIFAVLAAALAVYLVVFIRKRWGRGRPPEVP